MAVSVVNCLARGCYLAAVVLCVLNKESDMNKFLKAVLCILKNATIVIPLIEGVVHSVQSLVNPPLEKCENEKCTGASSAR